MLSSFFDQFIIIPLLSGWWNNSYLMVMVVVLMAYLLFFQVFLIPRRWQVLLEGLYQHWWETLQTGLGAHAGIYFPFIFALFFLIGLLNLMGLFPYVFTVATHIAITFGFSFSILMAVTILSLRKFGWDFFSLWMPAGAPLALAPLLVLIETASYFSRAISLGIRLAANLSAGHLLFAILASFGFQMVLAGWWGLSLIPIGIMIFITLLELAVALIQAYVFCLLTSIYLADTVALH
uniref:ATP synthase subunit a n=1 Tax=Haliclystus antarcticus TaxID=654955 RepID=A0A173FZM9_HALAN|nr:ATP synthase F0 subunit 6 [Haliclystus antarcticus]ANH09484.1 ATP synthase F0 subunit 6 [Haliclystus antarcticus]